MKDFKRRIAAFALLFASGCGGGGGQPTPPVATTPAPVSSTTPASTPTPAATPTPMFTPTPVATGTSAAVPAAEASVYAQEASDLNAYAAAVDAQCPANPSAATRFDVELLPSNASYLINVLPGMTVAQAQAMAGRALSFAVAVHKALPGIGFMINPTYPVLLQSQTNAPSWWSSSANYPIFAAYYGALASGLAQNGIPYDVETNLVFPSYSGQNYSSVTLAQLEAGVAEEASDVLLSMSPHELLYASEPLTLAQNTGQNSLDTVSGYQSFVAAVRPAIVVPAGSATAIGAGSADWSPPSFLTGVEGVGNLSFYDVHLYPPDYLASSGGGIAQVQMIDPSVSGEPGSITENWDEKDAGDAANYGAANAMALEAQDAYSFWAPLDAQYVASTMQLARCHNLSVVNFWYVYELFGYLDYSTASTMSTSAASTAEATAASQNASAGILSASGQAFYTSLTGHAPASAARRSR